MDRKGFQGYQGYKEQGINEMTPGELLLLLYDELIKRLLRADLALGKADYPCSRPAWIGAWTSSAIWTTPWTCSIPSAAT